MRMTSQLQLEQRFEPDKTQRPTYLDCLSFFPNDQFEKASEGGLDLLTFVFAAGSSATFLHPLFDEETLVGPPYLKPMKAKVFKTLRSSTANALKYSSLKGSPLDMDLNQR